MTIAGEITSMSDHENGGVALEAAAVGVVLFVGSQFAVDW
jgi:hypothetical protein